ncbi:MAG: response regulator transcription factor [Muribaculaceae bacterium]|nr:response regulator transcription factor [Muribaculaceae bacterium]MDE5923902.1 response regulator transcription factor [Muribaculaceae bacterium]
MNTKILVVDDEETLCEALGFNLEMEGYDVVAVNSAEEALTLDLPSFDLIILDVMMGEISGFQFARILKSNPATSSIPLIFCTARDSEDDLVAGLDMGGDDYITKPYSLRTLLARVRTALRKHRLPQSEATAHTSETFTFEGLTVIGASKECIVDGVDVRLPRKEFEILRLLMSKIGHVFSREQIISHVWPDEVVVLDRVVDVNITRIRKKIGRYGSHIVTRSGYGYGFME